jgi:hypothetical protein
MANADQAGSEIAPVWPAAVALALTNVTVPKFARGSGTQKPLRVQAEGASAIHSADETSGDFMVSFFVKTLSRVKLRIWTVTLRPETATLATMESPGLIASLIVTGAAGTSSYQTKYEACPTTEQSASVPTCSSACDPGLYPPSPTQNAE